MATNSQRGKTVSIGYPGRGAQRLKVETPQGLIHIEADHTDSEGRPVLYISVGATQFAGEMPYVLAAMFLEVRPGADAPQRTGLGLRLVQADHAHTHPATGQMLWQGLHEECPFCHAYEGDRPVTPAPGQEVALRYLPVGATFRPAPGVFGMDAGVTYTVLAHMDGRGKRHSTGVLGQTAYRMDWPHLQATEGVSQDTLHVVVVSLP